MALRKETQAQKTNLEIELKRMLTSVATLVGLTLEEFACHFIISEEPIHIPTKVLDTQYFTSLLELFTAR